MTMPTSLLKPTSDLSKVADVTVQCGNSELSAFMMIEPASQSPRRGLFMLPAVNHVVKGFVMVPIANTTDEDIVLPK